MAVVEKIIVYTIHNSEGLYYPANARSILSDWTKSLAGAKKYHTENAVMKTFKFAKNKFGEDNTFIGEYELILKNSMTNTMRQRFKKLSKIKKIIKDRNYESIN